MKKCKNFGLVMYIGNVYSHCLLLLSKADEFYFPHRLLNFLFCFFFLVLVCFYFITHYHIAVSIFVCSRFIAACRHFTKRLAKRREIESRRMSFLCINWDLFLKWPKNMNIWKKMSISTTIWPSSWKNVCMHSGMWSHQRKSKPKCFYQLLHLRLYNSLLLSSTPNKQIFASGRFTFKTKLLSVSTMHDDDTVNIPNYIFATDVKCTCSRLDKRPNISHCMRHKSFFMSSCRFHEIYLKINIRGHHHIHTIRTICVLI